MHLGDFSVGTKKRKLGRFFNQAIGRSGGPVKVPPLSLGEDEDDYARTRRLLGDNIILDDHLIVGTSLRILGPAEG